METIAENIMAENLILGDCIFRHRTCLRESQEVFAEKCGLSTDTISLLERGKLNPSLLTLKKISIHINVSIPEMFAGESKSEVRE